MFLRQMPEQRLDSSVRLREYPRFPWISGHTERRRREFLSYNLTDFCITTPDLLPNIRIFVQSGLVVQCSKKEQKKTGVAKRSRDFAAEQGKCWVRCRERWAWGKWIEKLTNRKCLMRKDFRRQFCLLSNSFPRWHADCNYPPRVGCESQSKYLTTSSDHPTHTSHQSRHGDWLLRVGLTPCRQLFYRPQRPQPVVFTY